ncbi:hypothetical protein PMAYCL1PPCAC_04702, partial [Pristionchus mayeri]
WAFGMFIAVVSMIRSAQNELNQGMKHASRLTLKFQKRAITSLALQVYCFIGIVPSIFYLLPLCGLGIIALYTKSMDPEEAASNKIASKISSFAFAIASFHTLAHSITVIACSPTYQRTISHLLIACFDRMRSTLSGKSYVSRQRSNTILF